MNNKVQEYLKEIQALKSGPHANRKMEWQGVVSKVMPDILKAANLNENISAPKGRKAQLCHQARTAVMKLASSYMSYITPMGQKWFAYAPWKQHRYENETELEEATDALNRASDDVFEECEKSNLYNELFPAFYDLACTGTTLIYCEFDSEIQELKFKHHPVGTFDLGPEGTQKVAIDFKMTAEQIADTFPDVSLPGSVLAALREGATNEFTITQYVKPRSGADETFDAVNSLTWPFANIYVLQNEQLLLKEDGYQEFPFAILRFTRTGNQVYGVSPLLGVEKLIDQILDMETACVEAAKRRAIPPVLVPPDMRGQVSLGAGQQTIVPRHYINSSMPREWALSSDTRELLEQLAMKGKHLNDAMFITFLEVISGVEDSHQMTATEVQAREAEKVMAYVQPFVQFTTDWKPMQKRIFAECARHDLIDTEDLQEAMAGDEEARYLTMPKVAYLGRMAQALQRAQLTNTDTSAARLIELANMMQNPDLLMFVNWEKLGKGQAIANGMPARYMRSRAEVEIERQKLLERQQQTQQAETNLVNAEAAAQSANAALAVRQMENL